MDDLTIALTVTMGAFLVPSLVYVLWASVCLIKEGLKR